MLIVVAVLLVGALVIATTMGLGPLASERTGERPGVLGGAGPSLALVVGAGIVLVAVSLALVGVVGLRGQSDEAPGRPTTDRAATTAPSEPRATAVAPTEKVPGATTATEPAGGAVLGPLVRLTAEESKEEASTFPRSYEVLDELQPNTVLRVRARGFEPFASAFARQCLLAPRHRCGNPIAVQFDAEGTASFQYLVSDDFVTPRKEAVCRATTAPCSIVVESTDGADRAERQTIFHDSVPPPGRIRVHPASGLVDGDEVTVRVENYPPGARLQAMLCAPPAATGSDRCGEPGPTAPLTVGPDGAGRTTLTIMSGPVGSDRVPCGRGRVCGVSVASATVFTGAPVVRVTFAAPPGAGYDPARLAVGLGVAALLLGIATWLVRRTDWSPIGEEAAPEIDDAEYADLDALVADLPPEEDLDDLLRRLP